MKLREVFSVHKLPPLHRRALAAYIWRKFLGSPEPICRWRRTASSGS